MDSASSSPPPSEGSPGPEIPGWQKLPATGAERRVPPVLLLSMVLIIATAGLVYELAIAAVASYLLGDSVAQFSTIIGVYLSAMGLGAYLSRFVGPRLAETFVDVELATALIGGFSAPALFVAFTLTSAFQLILYTTVIVVGVLVGLELPLLIRILEHRLTFKDLIAKALTFDYAGALIGSLAFSLWLVPQLGLVHTSLVCGILNAIVGLISSYLLSEFGSKPRSLVPGRIRAFIVLLLLGIGLLQAERVSEISDASLYSGRVIYAEQTRYQRIVLTAEHERVALHLNGHLQFSSADEHRYHEALVHPALASATRRNHVLIAGGGDGLAAREVLKWSDVKRITLVDLDAGVTNLAREHPILRKLNRGALHDGRVQIVNADAMIWLRETGEIFDVLIFDFPDPSNYSLGKLYSREFYGLVRQHMRDDSRLVVQSTSPLFARSAYWCIVHTLAGVGLETLPYRAFVPSFGEWGFVLASVQKLEPPSHVSVADLRYLNDAVLASLFDFSKDMARVATKQNRLNNQALVQYYLAEWGKWQ